MSSGSEENAKISHNDEKKKILSKIKALQEKQLEALRMCLCVAGSINYREMNEVRCYPRPPRHFASLYSIILFILSEGQCSVSSWKEIRRSLRRIKDLRLALSMVDYRVVKGEFVTELKGMYAECQLLKKPGFLSMLSQQLGECIEHLIRFGEISTKILELGGSFPKEILSKDELLSKADSSHNKLATAQEILSSNNKNVTQLPLAEMSELKSYKRPSQLTANITGVFVQLYAAGMKDGEILKGTWNEVWKFFRSQHLQPDDNLILRIPDSVLKQVYHKVMIMQAGEVISEKTTSAHCMKLWNWVLMVLEFRKIHDEHCKIKSKIESRSVRKGPIITDIDAYSLPPALPSYEEERDRYMDGTPVVSKSTDGSLRSNRSKADSKVLSSSFTAYKDKYLECSQKLNMQRIAGSLSINGREEDLFQTNSDNTKFPPPRHNGHLLPLKSDSVTHKDGNQSSNRMWTNAEVVSSLTKTSQANSQARQRLINSIRKVMQHTNEGDEKVIESSSSSSEKPKTPIDSSIESCHLPQAPVVAIPKTNPNKRKVLALN